MGWGLEAEACVCFESSPRSRDRPRGGSRLALVTDIEFYPARVAIVLTSACCASGFNP